MKITQIETIRIRELPQLIWVQVHTDAGLVGLGETFFHPTAVEAYLHDNVAQELIGRDPLSIDAISRDLVTYVGFRSTGVESRAASAIDLALWDLFGKAAGQPLVQMLGGWTRDKIRTYNTCAGSDYMRRSETQSTRNWGLGIAGNHKGISGFDDLNDFLHRADD